MKYLNKLASIFCGAVIGVSALTSCEGGDLFNIDAPDWLASRIDSIANSKKGGEEVLEGMMEDVYTIGATDFSTGWWQEFSKYYVIPENAKWNAVFNLNINPSAPNTYKNFALILSNDVDRGGDGYAEYGAIRFDNQPSGNSEWGNYIDRGFVESNLTFATDTDKGVEKLGGKVTVTVDRSRVDTFFVKITNGTVTKTYTQPSAIANLNSDGSNTNIRAFLVPEGSFIEFLQTNIEPIGGCTSAEDKQPVSMELVGVPTEVLIGTKLEDAMANVTATVTFEEGVTKTVTAEELQFQTIPDYETTGQKTLVALYNKTFKGVNCDKPIIATKTFSVVRQLSAFTATVVVPTPTVLGAEDNTTAFWGAHSSSFKVSPKETKIVHFTNYTSGVESWNNFCVVLTKGDEKTEYAVVRADNYGWGNGYAACTAEGTQGDMKTWLAAMNGASVTAYITNNGDGTADIKLNMVGNNNEVYTQYYSGINTIDPDDMYFRFTVDNCHLVFDSVVGAADNTTAFWGAHSSSFRVDSHQVCTINFTNYTSGVESWNNFCVVLTKGDEKTEYAVVRADNYGWGTGYAACTANGTQGDMKTWLAAMNGAKCSVKIANNGDGTADVKCVMHGTNGVEYVQNYIGINGIDPEDFCFRLTVDKSHFVLE